MTPTFQEIVSAVTTVGLPGVTMGYILVVHAKNLVEIMRLLERIIEIQSGINKTLDDLSEKIDLKR